jgi:hypothetical protein
MHPIWRPCLNTCFDEPSIVFMYIFPTGENYSLMVLYPLKTFQDISLLHASALYATVLPAMAVTVTFEM